MSKERIEIGTVVEVADAKQSINELRQSIEDSKTSLKSLNSGTEDYNNEIKGLVSAQKDLIGLQESLINKFEDTSSVTSNLNSNLSVATNTVNGMMGGFQALQGIMVLTGKENQNLVKTLVKLQAVSSVVQGFRQFTDAVKAGNMAFRIFNITVRANPLMLLVASILTVIELFKSFKGEVADTASMLKDLDVDIDANINFSGTSFKSGVDRIKEEARREIELLKAEGKDTAEAINDINKDMINKVNDLINSLVANSFDVMIRSINRDISDLKLGFNDAFNKLKVIEEMKQDFSISIKELMENRDLAEAFGDRALLEATNEGIERLREEFFNKFTKEGLKDKTAMEIMSTYESIVTLEKVYSSELSDFEHKQYLSEVQLKEEKKKRQKEYANSRLEGEKKLLSDLDAARTNANAAMENLLGQRNAIEKTANKESASNRKELLDIINSDNEANKINLENLKEQLKALPKTASSTKELINIYKQKADIINDMIAAEQALNATETESLHLNRERMEMEKEMVLETKLGDLQNKEARLGANDAGRYNSDLVERINIMKEAKQFQDQIADDNILLVDKETLSWELRLEALYKYNDAMSESYALESEINAAKLELKEREKLAINSTLQVTADAFMAMSDLAKEGTAVQKSLAIAGTTISTIAAAQNVFESTAKIPFVGKILAPIAAATATLQGIKRVKEITKVEVPGAKGGGNKVGMPQPQLLQAIPNIQQTVTKMDGDDLDIINKDSKVYVVESDITNQQRRVKVAENEASF